MQKRFNGECKMKFIKWWLITIAALLIIASILNTLKSFSYYYKMQDLEKRIEELEKGDDRAN